MAQLALGIVGSAFGPVGGFIGSAIGSMIDNQLFPNKSQGPRLTDLTVQISSYGKAIPLLFGPKNRVAGNVIWTSGLIEHERKSTVGGKGGPATQVTEWTYSISMAILLGEGPIIGVSEIWANSKKIYDAAEAAGQPGATAQGVYGPGATDLDFDQLFGTSHVVFDSLTVYPGDAYHDPDPTIESYKGVGNVPGYRRRALIVLKDLQLADYGNRPPNLEFLVVKSTGATVASISREIIERCGIDPNTASTARATKSILGYNIGRPSSGTGALQPLAMFGSIDVAEVNGQVRLTRRDGAPVAVIPDYETGAYQADQDRPERIRFTSALETRLPREANVTFSDPDRDFQVNAQVARHSSGSSQNNLAVELPIAMDVDDARQIADRALWEAIQGRQTATTQVTDRWIALQAGKKYIFTTEAGLEPLRVTRRTRGANGVIDLELRRDRAEVYMSRASGVAAASAEKSLGIPSDVELILLDIPILLDADDNAGFYFAIVASGTKSRGADVIRALDISSEYQEVAPVGLETIAGDVSGTMDADQTDGSGYDDTTVLTVTLRRDDMTLSSVTDDELAAGANAFFIGDPDDTTEGEIAQAGTVTLVGPGATYELTHWLRGKKGTEFATGLHASGEICVLLEPGRINRANYGTADLGLEHAFKAVPLLLNAEDITAVLFTNNGIGLRPYSPENLLITGDTGMDLVLSWDRRSRLESGALGEETELYTIRIMNSAGTVIERETTSTTPDFTYTVAMQTADFGAPVSDLRWRVAQVSAIYGNGIFAESNGPVP